MTSMSIQQRHMHHPAPWVLCGFLLSVYDSSFPKEPTGTHNPVEQCEGARGVLRVLRLHLPSRNYSQRSVASKNGHGCAIASRYIRGTKVTALFGDLFFCIYIYIWLQTLAIHFSKHLPLEVCFSFSPIVVCHLSKTENHKLRWV